MPNIKDPNSWEGYIKAAAAQYYDPSEIKIEGLEKMFMANEQFNTVFFHSVPLIYLADYTTGKYLLASKGTKMLLGYEPEEFKHGGFDLVQTNYQKEHMKLYNEQIFPDRLTILDQIPPEEHAKHIFSYTLRFKSKSGVYHTLLQRNCFIKSSRQGKPLLSFGMAMNITHFTPEQPVIQVVEKINTNHELALTSTPIHQKIYYLQKEDQLFSRRQIEILLWMAHGLTSKEIADKLFISEHTVINHRKNMLLKSGLNNVAALIAFAIRKHII